MILSENRQKTESQSYHKMTYDRKCLMVNLEDEEEVKRFKESQKTQETQRRPSKSLKKEKKEKKEKKHKKKQKKTVHSWVYPENFEEAPFPLLTLTYKKERVKLGQADSDYIFFGDLIAKFTTSSNILRFNEEIDLIYKVHFEIRSQINFIDNFLIIGLVDKSSQDKENPEVRYVSRGIRPKRGDYIGVYANRVTRLITFEVNHFIMDSIQITGDIINNFFHPFLFIDKPNGVIKLNCCLEDELK